MPAEPPDTMEMLTKPNNWYIQELKGRAYMKTTRLVFGIVGFILFFIIVLQSYSIVVLTALAGVTDNISAASAVILAIFLVAAGVTGISAKTNEGWIMSGCLYILGSLAGFVNHFAEIIIWAAVSAAFGTVCIVGSAVVRNRNKMMESKQI